MGCDLVTEGYVPCACRDCMDVAIGVRGEALCGECEEAGCEAGAEAECQRDDAYGCDERDPDPDEPEEEDWTTTDHVTFYQAGRVILSLEGRDCTEAEMWAHILSAMSTAGFWPNVWFISDHGNAHLMVPPPRKP